MSDLGREFAVQHDETSHKGVRQGEATADHALVIGVNDYAHVRPLRGAIADARAFADWLLDAQGGALPPANLRTILSTPSPVGPLVDEINSALEEILGRAEQTGGRRFYFYFSGHGCVGDKATDLALCLANWSQIRRRAALSSEAWLDVVVRSGIFDEVAFFFDCCRVWATRAVGLPPEVDYARPVKRERGTRVFLAYATEFQRVAMEISSIGDNASPEVRGIFTNALMTALRGAAVSPDGFVTADSLKKYLEQATEKRAHERGFQQRAEVLNGFENKSRFGGATLHPVIIRPARQLVPQFTPEQTAAVAWIASFLRLRATRQFEIYTAPGEEQGVSSRVLLAIIPRGSGQQSPTQKAAHGWSISRRDRTINLTAAVPINTKVNTPIIFSAHLSPGAYVLRNKGAAPRELSVHLYQGWTTVVAIDDVLDPHFEDARAFLVRGTTNPIPPFSHNEATVVHCLTKLQTSAHGTFIAPSTEHSATSFDNPMHAMVTAHLMTRQNNPDSNLIEAMTNRIESMLGPCPDVQALRLRVALIRGQDLTPMVGTDPPMLRAGLLAFVDASHYLPQLITPGSLLEFACIERLVDSPLSSWPVRPKYETGDDWLTAAIDDLATKHTGDSESLDMTTIAQELGVPTRAVTTRMAVTQVRTTKRNVVKENISQAVTTSLPPKEWGHAVPSIPGYEIEAMIGKGGMGQVYLAKPHHGTQHVAIKVMEPYAAASSGARKRFLREIEILLELKHERIVATIDRGEVHQSYYFVMPYYENGNLSQWVASRGRPSLETAVRITLEVLEGLAYAHDKGFVHRDIKPQNVLWNNANHVVIADFGLAKCFEDRDLSELTKSGTVMGTAAFMACEQVAHFKHVRPTADVWSVAALMYWLLCGATPREVSKRDHTFSDVVKRRVIPIRKRTAHIPPTLCDLLDRALSDDPQQRPIDASDFRIQLEAITDAYSRSYTSGP